MSARPPRWSSRLAGWATPASDRESVLGDLQERFQRRAERAGVPAARRWYRRQAVILAVALVPRRLGAALAGLAVPGTLRGAVRSLVRSPSTAALALATLTVGVAAPSAVFGLLGGFTSSLPGDENGRIVALEVVAPSAGGAPALPWSAVATWAETTAGPAGPFEALAAFRSDGGVAVAAEGAWAARYPAAWMSADAFRVLDVEPVAGRLYRNGERVGGLPAALVSEAIWADRFDRDPGALGRTLRIDGVDHVVVGVLPADFGFPVDQRVWMEPDPDAPASWQAVARLAPDVTTQAAEERLTALVGAQPEFAAMASGPANLRARVEPYAAAHWGDDTEGMAQFLAISVLLLVVAAVNVANIMLARGARRADETTVRLALGGSRLQVMLPLLAEVAVLAGIGSMLGLAVGRAALDAMVGHITRNGIEMPYWMDFSDGSASVLFAAGMAVLAAMVSGLVPALRTSKLDAHGALRVRSDAGPGGSARLMTAVVGVEVAVSCTLLLFCGVAVADAVASERKGLEFPTRGVATGRLVLEDFDYPDGEARLRLAHGFLDALRARPEVEAAALTTSIPGTARGSRPVALEGVDELSGDPPSAVVRTVDPGFFEMMAVEPTAGRLLAASDGPGTPIVAVVNRGFAVSRSADANPVGRRITWRGDDGEPTSATIVGVVDDRGVTPDERGSPTAGVYFAWAQHSPDVLRPLTVLRNPGTPVPDVWREVLAALDPNLPLHDVRTLDEELARDRSGSTLVVALFGAFGAFALLLSVVGLHGVHAFLMAGRTRELGVRRALGAPTGRLLRQSLTKGLRPVGVGLLVGFAAGWALVRTSTVLGTDLESGLAYRVAMVTVPLLLLATSALAVWWPTRRASNTDPAAVLREG